MIVLITLSNCSPKLGKQFYNSEDEIIIKKIAIYLPNGWNVGLMSANYPGVMAIIKDKFVFDAQGAGSRPWMPYLDYLTIEKANITSINISEEKALKRKVITINTNQQKFEFYLTDADEFYVKLQNWIK